MSRKPMPPKNPEAWMARAIELAEKGRFHTSPNPMVGACVVRGGKLLAEGYHVRYGGDHAEIIALRKAGKRARGASLYVTLEPCATWGKTPPCVDAVIQSGVREVIVGALDPNPANHDKSTSLLRKRGIRVRTGILAGQIERQNEAFFKFAKTRLPFITLKMAQSLDGKIASRTGLSRWISSPASRDFVHLLRAEQDAILVGKNTLYKDDPALTPHLKNFKKDAGKPWRVALDPSFKISPRARIFKGETLSILAVSESKIKKLLRKSSRGVVLLPVKEVKGRLDITDLVKKLGSLGVAKLLAEGGGELAASLLDAGLVDKCCWLIAPKIFGGRDAKTSVEGSGVARPSDARVFKNFSWSRVGDDLLFEGYF